VSEEIVEVLGDVEVLDDVEDCKGSNDEMGQLILTNLRMIWLYKKNKKINLSSDTIISELWLSRRW